MGVDAEQVPKEGGGVQMSELKYYKLFHRASALTSPEFISVVEFGPNEEVYLKSEADKVIAEKDKEIEELKSDISDLRDDKRLTDSILVERNTEIAELENRIADGDKDFEIADNQNKRLLQIVRHHKYKRCLAMANWCEATTLWCYQAANTLPVGIHATLFGKPVMIEPKRLFKRFELLNKWHKRWYALADKFKEAK